MPIVMFLGWLLWIFAIYIAWRIVKAFDLIASSFADIASTLRNQQQKVISYRPLPCAAGFFFAVINFRRSPAGRESMLRVFLGSLAKTISCACVR
jgi:hypothetical protein